MGPIQQKWARPKPTAIKREDIFHDSVDISLVPRASMSKNTSFYPFNMTNKTEIAYLDEFEGDYQPTKKAKVVYFNPLLQKYNACFYNWMLDDHPFTLEETDVIVTKELVESCVDKRLTRHLKLRPLGTVSDHLILAFCHLVRKDIANAGRELGLVFDLIMMAEDKGYMTKEQGQGMSHVYFGLVAMTEQLMMDVGRDKSWHKSNLKHYIDTCIRENAPYSYPASARAAIQFVKGAFMGSRRFWHERINLLEKVAKIEPENLEGWIALFNCYRLTRKCDDFFDPYPSPNEEYALIEAWKLDRSNPLVKLSISIYLSDILRSRKHKFQPDEGWVILNGVDVFYSINEVVDYIKIVCFLSDSEDMKESVRDNVSIGDIVMTGLPCHYSDCILAKKCFEAALFLNPNCSSANHKLGLLKLKLGNPIESVLPHFQKAFRIDPRNYPSLIDSIQLMLSKPKEREEELWNLFREALSEGKYSDAQLLSLRLLKGIFLYMLGDKDRAMSVFVDVLRLNRRKALEILKKIPYLNKRYGWDTKLINGPQVLKLLNIDYDERAYRKGYKRGIGGGTSTQQDGMIGTLNKAYIAGRWEDQGYQRSSDDMEEIDNGQLGTCPKGNGEVGKSTPSRDNARFRNGRGRDRASASNIGDGGYEFKYF